MVKENWIIKNLNVNPPVDINTSGGYSVEQILNNKNCSKDVKYWINIAGTDRYLFKSEIAESWEFWDKDVVNPIRNTNQIYIRFLDVSSFIGPSNYFREHKVYTFFAPGTIGYDIELNNSSGFSGLPGGFYGIINFGRAGHIAIWWSSSEY